MYTTGDLDKSTHKKLMYVGSTHLEVKKKKNGKDVKITKIKNYPNSICFLTVNSYMCLTLSHITTVCSC